MKVQSGGHSPVNRQDSRAGGECCLGGNGGKLPQSNNTGMTHA